MLRIPKWGRHRAKESGERSDQSGASQLQSWAEKEGWGGGGGGFSFLFTPLGSLPTREVANCRGS